MTWLCRGCSDWYVIEQNWLPPVVARYYKPQSYRNFIVMDTFLCFNIIRNLWMEILEIVLRLHIKWLFDVGRDNVTSLNVM